MSVDTAGSVVLPHPEPGASAPATCPHGAAASAPQIDDATRAELWMDQSRRLSRIAESIAKVSHRVNGIAADPRVRQSLAAEPRAAARCFAALSRILLGKSRLGCAPHGGRFAKAIASASSLVGRDSLAAQTAALALRLRIRAMALSHPELHEDPEIAAIIAALEADDQLQAVRLFRRARSGTAGNQLLTRIAPVFDEVTALMAMLDNNPFNDAVAWSLTTGGDPRGEPLLGVSMDWIAQFEKGVGIAAQAEIRTEVREHLNTDFGIEAHLRNIHAVRNEGGFVMIQHLACDDGRKRYIVELPGMTADCLRSDSTQDVLGAIRNTRCSDSTYTRALKSAIDAESLPEGSELAFIGHSQGGAVAMNLGEDADFTDRYRVTHIVAVGSPVDHKKPHPSIWCATVTNQHDLVPSLDGRGPGNPFNPHPDWFEVDFADPTHGFPACHGAQRYADNLRDDIPHAAARIDEAMVAYRGAVVRTTAWTLTD